MTATLPRQTREPDGEPDGALILLHGRGADEHDLRPLLDELDPERRLLGVTPGGPLTNLPPGGRHWYIVKQIGNPDVETFSAGIATVTEVCDDLLSERGIGWDRTVIGGFSQGAAMALAVAFGTDRPQAAGAIAMSGFLPTVEGWPIEIAAKQSMPVLICHGSLDPVIPVEFGRNARDRLEAGGVEVTYLEPPMVHGIDRAVIPEIREWVGARIPH